MTKLIGKGQAMAGKIDYQVRVQVFNMIYEDYRESIERYLVTLVYEQEQARDLCHVTFEQFWEFLCKETVVKQIAYYKNWLYKTAKYRAIDYLRRNKPIVYLSQSESEANSWFDELRTEVFEDRIDLICLLDGLLQLPQQQRDVVVAMLKGFKQKDIAAKSGISKSTVSEYVKLARAQLYRKVYPVTEDMKSVGIPFAYLATKPYMDMRIDNLLGEEYDWHTENPEAGTDSINPVIERKWKRLDKILGPAREFIEREANRTEKSPHVSEALRYIRQWEASLIIPVDRPTWPPDSFRNVRGASLMVPVDRPLWPLEDYRSDWWNYVPD